MNKSLEPEPVVNEELWRIWVDRGLRQNRTSSRNWKIGTISAMAVAGLAGLVYLAGLF